MRYARIYPWRRTRRFRAPSNGPEAFFVAQFSAGCTNNIFGFDLRQGQPICPDLIYDRHNPRRTVFLPSLKESALTISRTDTLNGDRSSGRPPGPSAPTKGGNTPSMLKSGNGMNVRVGWRGRVAGRFGACGEGPANENRLV